MQCVSMVVVERKEGTKRERERERTSNLVAFYTAVWYITSRTCVLGGLDGTSDPIHVHQS